MSLECKHTSFDEDDLAELYCLILKKQDGTATQQELQRLVDLSIDYLCYGKELIETYLSCHGYYTEQDMLKCWFGEGFYLFGEPLLRGIREAVTAMEHSSDPYDEAGTVVWEVPNVDVYITFEDILLTGFKSIYNAYHRFISSQDYVKDMVKTLNKIEHFLTYGNNYTLSELILLVDRLTNTIHYGGALLDTYGGIDVEAAKSQAEDLAKEGDCTCQ